MNWPSVYCKVTTALQISGNLAAGRYMLSD